MYEQFEEWLNSVLDTGLPQETIGVGFNIYEDCNMKWSIQLISTDSFDEEDEDWMCEEIFSTEENLFTWQSEDNWEMILQQAMHLASSYLDKGKYANALKQYKGIGIGFVDGDTEIIYKR